MSHTTHLHNSLWVSGIGAQLRLLSNGVETSRQAQCPEHHAGHSHTSPELSAHLGSKEADCEGKSHHRTGVMLQLVSCSCWWVKTNACTGAHRDYGKQEATGEAKEDLRCDWQAWELTRQTSNSSSSTSASHLRDAPQVNSEKGTWHSTVNSSQGKSKIPPASLRSTLDSEHTLHCELSILHLGRAPLDGYCMHHQMGDSLHLQDTMRDRIHGKTCGFHLLAIGLVKH